MALAMISAQLALVSEILTEICAHYDQVLLEPSMTLGQLGLDSLSFLQFVVLFEERTGHDLTLYNLDQSMKLDEIFNLIPPLQIP